MSEQFDKDRPDKDLPDEQQFEEYLRGGSDVSRQYRQLHSAEVPAELDRLVMRQAQDAVKSRPAKSRTWMRWTGPLALAASAVLVVSIVIESGVQEDTYLTVPASAPAEPPPKQEAAEQDQTTAGSVRDSSVVHIMPVSPAVPPAFEAPPISVEQPAAFRDQAVQPSEPAPAQFTSAEPLMKVEPPPPDLARRNRAEAVAQTSSRTAAPAPVPAPVHAPVHASVAPEVSMRQEDVSVEEIAVTGMKRHERKQTAGPRNTIAAPAANSASDADEQEQERREYSDPEQWLRDIRELRKENKHEAADREWRRFRYVYPNYKVAENDAARGASR